MTILSLEEFAILNTLADINPENRNRYSWVKFLTDKNLFQCLICNEEITPSHDVMLHYSLNYNVIEHGLFHIEKSILKSFI